MSDARTVSGNIAVEQDGRFGSALKLMERIGRFESDANGAEQKTRNYWLRLYADCVNATYMNVPE